VTVRREAVRNCSMAESTVIIRKIPRIYINTDNRKYPLAEEQ